MRPAFSFILSKMLVIMVQIHSKYGGAYKIKFYKSGEAKIAYISNLGSSVLVHKNNFKEVLDTVLKFYEKKEDYDKCSEILLIKNSLI